MSVTPAGFVHAGNAPLEVAGVVCPVLVVLGVGIWAPTSITGLEKR